MTRLKFGAPVLVALLLGCAMFKADARLDGFGRRFIGFVESGDSASIIPVVDPSLTTYTAWKQIAALRDTLRSLHRDSTALVGWNVFESPGSYQANLTYEIHGRGWALVAIPITRREGRLVATGMHFERQPASLAEQNAFRFGGQPWDHYLVLLCVAIAFVFSLSAAVIVGRTRMPRRWLWAIVALVGYGQYSMNWSNGASNFDPMRFQLLGAGAVRYGFVGPWIVSFALPLGAAIALWRRHTFLRAVPASEKLVTDASSSITAGTEVSVD